MKNFRNIIVTLVGVLFFIYGNSQIIFDPTLLILTPHTIISDKKLNTEIKNYENEIIKNRENILKEIENLIVENEFSEENIKIMYQKKIDFSKEMNFNSIIPSISEEYLQYKFHERFKNLLIYAIKEKSTGSLEELSFLAEIHKIQYVLNFPKINSYFEKGKKMSAITVQLYDHQKKQIIFEKEFIGGNRNPGFEFTCNDKSLICTYNNSLELALKEITYIIASNNTSIIKEKQIAKERTDILFTKYYPTRPPIEIVDIISKNDTNISVNGYYHGLIDESKTKFVGFFAHYNQINNFGDIKKANDKNVTIITDEMGDFSKSPEIYAYLILGILYKSKWYFKKTDATYFNSDSFENGKKEFFNKLQEWHFFKDESSEYDPQFWETYFFSKIESSVDKNKAKIEKYNKLKDLSSDLDDKETYQEMINDFYEYDLKNQNYFGLYNIVAEKFKKHEEEQELKFTSHLNDLIFKPFFDKYIKESNDKIVEYIKINNNDLKLIYPKNKKVILCPILFNYQKDKLKLEYFVLIYNENEQNKIYKWNFFEPITPKYGNMYGSDIYEQLNTITMWNFSFDSLEDVKFWDDYILKKTDNEQYKYLIEIR